VSSGSDRLLQAVGRRTSVRTQIVARALVCGIFGLINKIGPADADLVGRLTDLVAHRDPNGRSARVSGNVGLDHRRLAIFDLNEDGAQPRRDTRHPIWITYNGEIYNYLELRAELESFVFVFKSSSDTEVLLAAHVCWGEKCLERFNGLWSFAIHDERDNTLFCARDRFGVEPFYYADTATEFAFGCETRQLFAISGPTLSRKTIWSAIFFRFRLVEKCSTSLSRNWRDFYF
jgi:asparagine synthase (glutamine-hydrolysing)